MNIVKRAVVLVAIGAIGLGACGTDSPSPAVTGNSSGTEVMTDSTKAMTDKTEVMTDSSKAMTDASTSTTAG